MRRNTKVIFMTFIAVLTSAEDFCCWTMALSCLEKATCKSFSSTQYVFFLASNYDEPDRYNIWHSIDFFCPHSSLFLCLYIAIYGARDIAAACLPKVDKRGKYTMRARVAMPCTCAWQRHGRARGNAMGACVVYPCTYTCCDENLMAMIMWWGALMITHTVTFISTSDHYGIISIEMANKLCELHSNYLAIVSSFTTCDFHAGIYWW